jgi:hypothetical protein
VLWDYELDRLILEEERWADLAAKGFDQPRQFAAFLHTLRWNCVTATDPNLFQAPFRAGIKIDAYQMEPLRKALRLPRVNLFIADDTGLGKTIEAGLIARELLLRKKAKTIVVATPPSVLDQWKAELEERFGLVFELLDRAYLTRMRRERGFGVNPWRTHSRFLVSHNLLIDSAYTDPCVSGLVRSCREAFWFWTKRITPRRPAGVAMGSRPNSRAPCAISQVASSTVCSFPQRPTTATRTAFPRSSSCSTRTASPAASRFGVNQHRSGTPLLIRFNALIFLLEFSFGVGSQSAPIGTPPPCRFLQLFRGVGPVSVGVPLGC